MGLTVPRYEQPQIKSGGIGGVAAAPEIHPIADKLSSGMGRLGGFIGGIVDKAVEKAVENADTSAMDEAKISILGAKNQLSVEMKQVKGKAVEEGKAFDGGDDDGSPNLTDHYLSEYDDRVKKATEKLNPALQERMKTFIGTHKVSFEGDLLTHESNERDKYQLADKLQLHDAAKESAALELRNKGFLSPETLEEVKTSAADIATRTGKETPEMARKGAESGIYSEHITFLIGNQDKVAAVNQFNAYKDKIEAKDFDKLNPHIEVFKGDLAGDTVAGSVFDSLAPQTVDDEINVSAMRKQVAALKVGSTVEVPGVGSVTVNDQTKKRAELKVEEMARETEAARQSTAKVFTREVHGFVQSGARYSDAVSMVESSDKVDTVTKDNLYDYLDHKYRISESRAEAKADAKDAKNRRQLIELLKKQADYVNGDSKPMTPEDAAQFAGSLGKYTDTFIKFVDDVNNNPAAKVQDAELIDLIRTIKSTDTEGRYADVFPAVDKPTDVDKAKLALLQGQVQATMAAAKKNNLKITVESALLSAVKKVETDGNYRFTKTEEPIYLLNTKYATKYGKDPQRWPKETRREFVRRAYSLKFPKAPGLSDAETDKYGFLLTEQEFNQ